VDGGHSFSNDPTAWVQGNSPDSPIADPSASGAYPLIGTANGVACTCYHSRDQEKSLAGVMSYISDAAINVDLEKASWQPAGLAPLSKQWRAAIKTTFLSNSDGLNLELEPVGKGSVCSQSGIFGG